MCLNKDYKYYIIFIYTYTLEKSQQLVVAFLFFQNNYKFCNTLRFSKVLLIDRGIILLFIAINLFKLIIILSNICIIWQLILLFIGI